MQRLNENIFHLYNKWKDGYVRKENSVNLMLNNLIDNFPYLKNDLKISENGKSVDIIGGVNIGGHAVFVVQDKYLINGKLPFPFGECKCDYYIESDLKSLDGSPKKVDGGFYCIRCKSITSLKGISEEISGDLDIVSTPITSLEYFPKYIGGNIEMDSRLEGEKIPDGVVIKGKIKYV